MVKISDMNIDDLVNDLYDEVEELDDIILSNYLSKGSRWLLTYEYDDLYSKACMLDAKIELYEVLIDNEIELNG